MAALVNRMPREQPKLNSPLLETGMFRNSKQKPWPRLPKERKLLPFMVSYNSSLPYYCRRKLDKKTQISFSSILASLLKIVISLPVNSKIKSSGL